MTHADRDASEQPQPTPTDPDNEAAKRLWDVTRAAMRSAANAARTPETRCAPAGDPNSPDVGTDTPAPENGAQASIGARAAKWIAAVRGLSYDEERRGRDLMALADTEIQAATAQLRAEVERLRKWAPSTRIERLLEASSLGSEEVRRRSEDANRDQARILVRWADEIGAREKAEAQRDAALATVRNLEGQLAEADGKVPMVRALTARLNTAEPKLDAWRKWGQDRGYGLGPEAPAEEADL